MIIDGRALARDILAESKALVASLGRTPVVRAVAVAPGTVTESYLRVKNARAADAGMRLDVVRLLHDATTDDVLAALAAPGADAVIVQLPLPDHIDQDRVFAGIPLEKDADVLSPAAREAFAQDAADALIPPVADAVAAILSKGGVAPDGAQAAVVGKGYLVGAPVATYLRLHGAHVTVLDKASFAPDALLDADIVISGAGAPHLITPDLVKEGAALIDAGTSEQAGAVVGDIDPACAEKAGLFTPVPGGVGPVAVACLYRNAAKLAARSAGRPQETA